MTRDPKLDVVEEGPCSSCGDGDTAQEFHAHATLVHSHNGWKCNCRQPEELPTDRLPKIGEALYGPGCKTSAPAQPEEDAVTEEGRAAADEAMADACCDPVPAQPEEPDKICTHGGLLGNYPDCCNPVPEEEKPTEMYVCEIAHLILHPGQLYCFVVHPECTDCKAYLGQHAPVQPLGHPYEECDWESGGCDNRGCHHVSAGSILFCGKSPEEHRHRPRLRPASVSPRTGSLTPSA